jgi:hypothetical protein
MPEDGTHDGTFHRPLQHRIRGHHLGGVLMLPALAGLAAAGRTMAQVGCFGKRIAQAFHRHVMSSRTGVVEPMIHRDDGVAKELCTTFRHVILMMFFNILP